MSSHAQCLILGDSLAVGIGIFKKECQQISKVGISSHLFIQQTLPMANAVLISLGSNDQKDTEANITTLRSYYRTAKVTWIAPIKNGPARQAVIAVSRQYGDTILDAQQYETAKDGIHPTMYGYRAMAQMWDIR